MVVVYKQYMNVYYNCTAALVTYNKKQLTK